MMAAGHHAKVGEGRVASAYAGNAEEDFAELITLRHLLHLGAGIGDGDEMLSGFVFADTFAACDQRNIA